MAGYIGNYPTAVPLSGADLTDGIITPAKLSTTLDLSSKTITLPSGVGGKVLQVVQGSTNTQVAHTTTYADTGLSASITPSSTSNKIFIIVNQHCYTQGNSGGAIKLLRDSTDIYAPGQTFAFYNEIANSHPRNYHNFSKLDSPSSTSSITYKTQARLYVSNAFRTQDGNHFTSFITLMEVSA